MLPFDAVVRKSQIFKKNGGHAGTPPPNYSSATFELNRCVGPKIPTLFIYCNLKQEAMIVLACTVVFLPYKTAKGKERGDNGEPQLFTAVRALGK